MYRLHLLSVFFSVMLFSVQGFAQAVTVIGGGQSAEDCYLSAQIASKPGAQLGFSEEPCNEALEFAQLNRRNRTAVLINRGIIRVANEQYQQGFKDYERALNLSPDVPETYVNLGNIYFLGEKLNKAVEFYTKALDLEISQDHIAYMNRGMALEKIGKLSEAESDYRRAIELMPEWGLPRERLEKLLTRTGGTNS
jgi:tetratricopeptide (TPR) repeat protein